MSTVSRTISRASTAIPSVKPGRVRNSTLRAPLAMDPKITNRVVSTFNHPFSCAFSIFKTSVVYRTCNRGRRGALRDCWHSG